MGNPLTFPDSKARYYQGLGLAFGAGLLWSLGGMLIKLVDWNPLAIAGMRSAIAFFVLLAVPRRPKLTWSGAQVGGALAYAATVILFVAANKLTTAANAILLQYTAPIYTAILGARFLGERVTRGDWATIVIVISGVMMFFVDRLTFGGLAGNLLALISGLTFAVLAVFLRKQKDESALESVLMGNLITALIGLPFMFQGSPGGQSWLGLVLLGVFQLGLSYLLYTEALKRISALEGTLITSIEPILNPVWVFLALGEKPGPWALIGGAMVLVAVTGRSLLKTSSPVSKRSN
ncbi:MAG: EamA family transporter [Deltaproteobacteria bacterium]|nr:EamA family transporter [Deltaproteobacteria bacterium]